MVSRNESLAPQHHIPNGYLGAPMSMITEHSIAIQFVIVALITVVLCFFQAEKLNDGLPTANKLFRWEPAFMARLRWINNAKSILWTADQKVHHTRTLKNLFQCPQLSLTLKHRQAQGRPYRLRRGDRDQIILPPNMIPELNALGPALNSREYHSFGLLGHLTGMDVVRLTSFHVRVLLSYISPALPRLFSITGARISTAIATEFPQTNQWTVMKPSKATVRCISEAIALTLFGAEMTHNNPELVHLTHEHTNNGEPFRRSSEAFSIVLNYPVLVFKVCFAMRCVPEILQPILVWIVPAKWRLISGWKKFRSYVVPEVLRQNDTRRKRNSNDRVAVNPDVISWMVEDGRNELERDPKTLTTLVGSIAAGSTYSITKFCCCTIADMVSQPDVLDAVRTEIREKHAQVDGRWDMAALASLEKLESAMKESGRLTPGTLLIYGRIVKKDCVLSNGLTLRRGQSVAMSCATRTMDPTIFEDPEEYQGLRFCAEDRIKDHRARPFSSVDTDILTWGAGRWSCPGRLITDMSAKILLVKLLDEYDFAFVNGKVLPQNAMHEFLFFHPENEMLVRRRDDASGILFV